MDLMGSSSQMKLNVVEIFMCLFLAERACTRLIIGRGSSKKKVLGGSLNKQAYVVVVRSLATTL